MEDASTALFVKAAAFAAERHRDQRRKDVNSSPYINHPLALADVLANEAGVVDIEVLCAAVLHDTIEDTQTSRAQISERFGEAIAAVVAEVTDNKNLKPEERKQLQITHAPSLSRSAKLVKLADKICNLRDILECPPSDWSAQRKREYFDWAARVVDGLRGTHVGIETVFDSLYARRDELC